MASVPHADRQPGRPAGAANRLGASVLAAEHDTGSDGT
jgi:hypothetical protein